MTADFRSPLHDPENCPNCRPILFDPRTGSANAKATRICEEVFDAATPSQRKAWHRVTCLNSRDFIDVNLSRQLVEAMQEKLDGDTDG